MRKFFLVLIIAFGLLFFRLFKLTVLEGKRYRMLSEGQRIREKIIAPSRGLIRDRNGVVLARNRPIYKSAKCKVQSAKCEDFEIISHEEAIEIEAKGGTEAANLKIEVAREYVGGEVLAHVIGYTGEVTEKEVQSAISKRSEESSPAMRGVKFKAQSYGLLTTDYKLGDRIGRMGVEEQYDEYLRGVNGKELIETNAKGELLRVLGRIDAKPGKDITLAIDFSLQKKASELLQDKKGAVVVSNPKNGQVLALFSSPSFDPNVFESEEGEERVEGILKDPKTPLFNRAIGGLYPPGSVFKIITAAAGLEERAIDRQTEIEDVGVIQIGPYRFANWYFTQYGKKEGMVDVARAIKRSNDIFFYKVGEMVGVEKLKKWAKKFGIARILGIDLLGEVEGVVPDPEWKKKVKGDSWFLGDTYHLAIGQGDLLVTPLQVNFWTSVIANGGKLCRPRVLLAESACQDIGLKGETISLIKEGMRQACQPGGTGWPLFGFRVRAAGKASGDARQGSSLDKLGMTLSEVEGSRFKADGKNFSDGGEGLVEIPTGCKTGTAEFGDPKGKTHAWFTVFAPAQDPQIVVTVLVEGGGEGSSVAGPIAKEILKAWFSR